MVRRAVRSEPAAGSVRAKPDSAWPLAELGQEAFLLLRRAEGAHRIDGADAAVDRRQAGDHGVVGGHARQEVGEARERGALAAVLRVDEHAPVAGVAQLAQHGRRHLALVVEDRAGLAMAAHDFQATLPSPCRTGATRASGGGAKRSSGTLPSQTALWMGLLTVWYCGLKSGSTCSSALSRAPVRRASSSVLPPRRRAVSAKLCCRWRRPVRNTQSHSGLVTPKQRDGSA